MSIWKRSVMKFGKAWDTGSVYDHFLKQEAFPLHLKRPWSKQPVPQPFGLPGFPAQR